MNLFTSGEEFLATLQVASIAAIAKFAHNFYGDDEITFRRFVGSVLIASVTAMGAYAFWVETMGFASGYAGVVIGVVSGLFTDHILRLIKNFVDKKGEQFLDKD